MDATPKASATPRRRFLELLVFAPAAAACSGAGAAKAARPSAALPPPAAAAIPPPPDPFAPIRAFPLPAGSEPAFVFRAAPARPRI